MATRNELEIDLTFDLEPHFLIALAVLLFICCVVCCFTVIMFKRNRTKGNSRTERMNCIDSDIDHSTDADADNIESDYYENEPDQAIVRKKLLINNADEYDTEEDKPQNV